MRVFMVAIALIGLVSAVALASTEQQKADEVAANFVADNNGNTGEVEGAVLAQNKAVEAAEAQDEAVEAAEVEDEAVGAGEAHNEGDDEEQDVEDEEEEEEEERPMIVLPPLEELLNNEAYPGYRMIEESLFQADDDKEVVNGVTAGELRYDQMNLENVRFCNVESFKARLALCDRTKTNFTANLFCRRTIRNLAILCYENLDEKIMDEKFVNALEVEVAISNEETEDPASFNYMKHETPLEIYIRGL